jgi:hypothetical protein
LEAPSSEQRGSTYTIDAAAFDTLSAQFVQAIAIVEFVADSSNFDREEALYGALTLLRRVHGALNGDELNRKEEVRHG